MLCVKGMRPLATGVLFIGSILQNAHAAEPQDNEASADVKETLIAKGEFFTPYLEPLYRPIPRQVSGVEKPELLLDGMWRTRIETEFAKLPTATRLTGAGWKEIQIPGQYEQQGLLNSTGGTVVFGKPNLMLTYSGLPIGKPLKLVVRYYTPPKESRVQSLRVAGKNLVDSFELTEGQESEQRFTLAADAVTKEGRLTIESIHHMGPNATINGIEIRRKGEVLVDEDFKGNKTKGELGEGCGFFTYPRSAGAPLATLVHDFEVPADWMGSSAALRFEAVYGEADYFLNGRKLGHSAMSFLPIEFDVSDALAPGKRNRLVVQLNMDTVGMHEVFAFGSGYAMHNIGGIHRSVRLFAKPRTHIERLILDTHLDETFTAGELRLKTRLQGRVGQATQLEVTATAPDGRIHSKRFDIPTVGKETILAMPIDNPVLWNAEKPRLYDVKIELLAKDEVLESLTRRVGFRRLEVVGSQLLVNGRPVKLAGVCRHEIDPLTGRADTARWGRIDAELFKQANCNYIRTSHYPPTREFLEACDELGIYVECEAPFTWVAKRIRLEGEPVDESPSALNWFLNPAAAMLEYHGANPSVIIWSIANESGYLRGEDDRLPDNFLKMNDFIKQRDPSRLTIFNNQMNHDGKRCDIACSHYNNPHSDPASYLVDRDDPRPILIDEMFHINTYNYEELTIDPGMREEWSRGIYRFGGNDTNPHWETNALWHRMVRSDRWLGVAIWGGIDETFVIGEDRVGYGQWGIIDGWRRKKPEWWLTKKLFSPVWLNGYNGDALPNGGRSLTLELENRYSFTDLNELRFVWSAGNQRIEMDGPSMAPASSGKWTVELPSVLESHWTLECIGSDGVSVVSYGLDLEENRQPELASPDRGAPEVRQNKERIGIKLEVDPVGGTGQSTLNLSGLPEVFVTQAEGKMIFVPTRPAYEELPGTATRYVETLTTENSEQNTTLTLRERVGEFEGGLSWVIDRAGRTILEYDYTRLAASAGAAAETGMLIRKVISGVVQARPASNSLSPSRHAGIISAPTTVPPFPPGCGNRISTILARRISAQQNSMWNTPSGVAIGEPVWPSLRPRAPIVFAPFTAMVNYS